MGAETITIQNLEIIEANALENYILVSGNVPGAKNALVFIKSAVKTDKKKEAKELLVYAEETVVDEIIEETVENAETTATESTVENAAETAE